MRSTAHAQSNFIQEVKTMIKHRKTDRKKPQKSFWEQVNSSNGIYYEPASSITHENQANVSSSRQIMDLPLSLTGVQIERPFQTVIPQEKVVKKVAKV